MTKSSTSKGPATLVEGLRNSPATKQLTDGARNLLDAHTSRLATRLGTGVGSAAEKLSEIGQTGQLPPVAEGAKRMLSGDGPVRSALGAATSGIAERAKNLVGGGGGGRGGGAPKAVNIEESIDIGVPVSVAYNQWTQFEDFSRFTKGVESVEQQNETETRWRVKVFKSRRTWTAKIREQVPDRRIAWTSDGPKGSTNGVVTFHPLADDLTRVLVAVEYYPSGVVEKVGNIWRAAGRRLRLDLKNFRRFVMMQNEPTGEWRGEIRDGKVVKQRDKQRDKQGSGRKGSGDAGRRQSSTSGSKSPARKSASGSPAKKSPARKSASGSPAKKSTSSRPRKSTSSSAPKKSTSQRGARTTSRSARGSRRGK
jgi:uncharacterized membrane protein